ncbi:DnaJ domain [Musa troglodytarum]|uniref:DnaJ domain n=1 Tax=Musa troglodytarum TaxID=320322 RepID=A0A9E7HHD1_9LILI|nr:DnaJ domain [Musa troglodytarum]
MAAGEEKIGDFYSVLGLRKECSEAELRIAYKKLAMFLLQGMGDFIGEIAQMMSQTKSGENGHDNFEELQQMFLDMFQDDLDAGFGDSSVYSGPQARPTDGLNCSMPSGPQFADGGSNGSNKRGNSGKAKLDGLENSATGFCFGVSD